MTDCNTPKDETCSSIDLVIVKVTIQNLEVK